MAQAVDIEIRVDQSGAVSGLRSFGTEMATTTNQVKQLSVALGDVNAKSARITPKTLAAGVSPGTAGLKQFSVGGGSSIFDGLKKDAGAATESVGQLNFSLGGVSSTLGTISTEAPALEKIGGHALTSLDNVRLLRDDLGIRIPRSMEKAIASSKALSGIVNGLGKGLLAVGAFQIGFSVAAQAYDQVKTLWDNWLSVTKAAKDYEDEVRKIQAEDFTNVHSIETAILRIDQATKSVAAYKALTDSMARQSWSELGQVGANPASLGAAITSRLTAHQFSKAETDAQRDVDKFNKEVIPEIRHQETLAKIASDHTPNRYMTPEEKIANELGQKNATDVENASYMRAKEGVRGNPVASNAVEAQRAIEVTANQRKAEGELAELRRQHSQELMHMQEAALEAGLRGSALYHAQEAAAISDLQFKDIDRARATESIRAKFHNEEMKRLQDQQLETQKILDDTKLAGLTGIAHVQQEGSNRVDEVNRDRDLDDNPQERAKRVAAIEGRTAQEIAAKQLEWTQRVDEVVEESQTKQVSGFARIRAEAEKARADLQRQFDESHSQMNLAAPGAQQVYDADTAKLGQGTAAIQQGSDYQQAQLAEKNAQETLQIEQEAQRKSMSAMRQQTAAINAEYAQRVTRYQEQLRQQEISQEDFDRRVAAAAQNRDAEMVEASRAAREKMAGEFDSLFKSLNHPMQALANLGEKVAGEAAAELVQRLQKRAGVSTADSPAKGGGAGILNLFTGLMDGSAFSASRPRPIVASAASPPPAGGTVQATATQGFWPWSGPHANNSAIAQPSNPLLASYRDVAPSHDAGHDNSGILEMASATIRIGLATISVTGGSPSSATPNAGTYASGIPSLLGESTTLLGGGVSAPEDSRTASLPRAALTRTVTQAGESNAAIGSTGAGSSSATSTPRFRVFGETRSVDEQSWDDEAPGSAIAGASSSVASSTLGRASRLMNGAAEAAAAPPSSQPGQAAGGILSQVHQSVQLATDARGIFQRRKADSPRNIYAGSASSETVSPGSSISSLASPASSSLPRTAAIAPPSSGDSAATTGARLYQPGASTSYATPETSTASAGGAGSSSVGPQGSLAGAVGDVPQKTSVFGTVIGDAAQIYEAGKAVKNQFAGSDKKKKDRQGLLNFPGGGSGATAPNNPGSSISASGIATTPTGTDELIDYETPSDGSSAPTALLDPGKDKSNAGMLGGGGVMANAEGAATGALGVFSAVKGDGGLGGALQGGMSGMKLGGALAGPLGAGIGLVAGTIIGAFGFGGREQARVYDLKTVRPKITGDLDSYHQGSMDYTSVYSDFQATDWQARLATGKMGPQGHNYYNDTIAKEIKQAEAKVTEEQKAGRSMYTTSAAQFALGTDSVPHDGYAVIHKHERIMRSDQNERITRAIENQDSPESMRSNYISAMQARDARSTSSSGNRSLTMNVHAMDTRGVAQFFDQHKHLMKASLNDASSENSGGGIA